MTAAGVFYPVGADSAEERLQYYASTFPVVEVDATYYALPAERTAQLWVDRTPPDFTFDIKAHALMTGQGTETKRLPKAIREELPDELKAKTRIYAKDLPAELHDEVWSMFRDGLAPLAERGQLGSILLQYPKWVFPSSENRAQIEDAVERLEGWTCAVEFRNGSWLNEKNAERTTRFLAERNIPFVMVDEPQGFKSSVPPQVARDVVGPGARAVPRPQRRDLGGEGHHPGRALPLPLLARRALGVGPADPRGGPGGEGSPPHVQQLLRELRDDERPRDRGPAGRGARQLGRGRLVPVRASGSPRSRRNRSMSAMRSSPDGRRSSSTIASSRWT